jgi:hypothetical protein
MPFSRRVSIQCVLVVAWIFAGCAATPQQKREAINPRNQTNSLPAPPETKNPPPPVGYWAVDPRATAHEAAIKYRRQYGGEISIAVKGPETNYSYYGRVRETYDKALKSVSKPWVQRNLLFRADGTGEDWFTDATAWRATDARFQWTVEPGILELRYSRFIFKAGFTTNEIRYPHPGGLLIFRPASPKPDYSEMNQAFTNYFVSLDAIVNALPSANSATGTVQIIDAWTLANETLCAAGERFAANYPAVYRQPEPPREFLVTFGEVERFKTRYAGLMDVFGRLGRQFIDVPEVQEAVNRFKKSTDRIDRLSKPLKK